ncbi:MAG TPA: ribose 5-phosphate isomerase B [bacterium]|nr:ribose 5-phosphate isomerase B [bacterium]HPJ71453.1 ribose 5-phosphate isomerase B [bacterium]HPQ66914.1 ribose 5-phosphate isomerase B [bacterium]
MTNATENNGFAGRIAVGSDHGGLELKQALISFLEGKGYTVKDVGTYDDRACDYPDYAGAVARSVASGDCDRGIMIDSFGVASGMAANKIRGVRAAVCWNRDTAISSREHNNANVLTLGGKILDPSLAEEMVSAWLTTPFAGGRHWPRVNKIMALERGPR